MKLAIPYFISKSKRVEIIFFTFIQAFPAKRVNISKYEEVSQVRFNRVLDSPGASCFLPNPNLRLGILEDALLKDSCT